jgi:hypothetical protein
VQSPIPSRKREITLYAIVPSADVGALAKSRRRLVLVTSGAVAAITAKSSVDGDLEPRALAHDAVVRRALLGCSAVIPFRFGATFPSLDAVTRVLEHNRAAIRAMLDRFTGRLEVGIKIRLPATPGEAANASPTMPGRLTRALEGVRALQEGPGDRREQIRTDAGKITFEGAYLIRAEQLPAFWEAAADVRVREPSFPMLSSGPWAPYSFCASLHEGEVH